MNTFIVVYILGCELVVFTVCVGVIFTFTAFYMEFTRPMTASHVAVPLPGARWCGFSCMHCKQRVTAAFCSGGEERVRHFHNGGGWVRRIVCVYIGAVIVRATLRLIRAR